MGKLSIGFLAVALTFVVLAPVACGPGERAAAPALPPGEHAFAGRWTVHGTGDGVPIGGNRWIAAYHFRGTIHFTGGGVLSDLGTRIVCFEHSTEGCKAGTVWTDADGDELFSEIRGSLIDRGGRSAGTITGGTGKFVGAAGSYTFKWTSVAHDDAPRVDAFSNDLKGVIRIPARTAEGSGR